MTAVLALTLALALQDPPSAAALDAAPVDDFSLDNGVRVSVVHAPTATKQAFLTLLPMGLLSDEVGHAQWSHLVEHVMIRSADPDVLGYEVDGTLLNGETTALALRMETFAPAADWRAAQQRHVRWLTTGQRSGAGLDELLEREKGRMAQELDTTVLAGFTHKWALAAWNQVVRHGVRHVRLSGDVQDATVEGVFDYISRHVQVGPGVQLVSVGPTDPAEVRAALAEDFGGLAGGAWVPAGASVETTRLFAPTELQASWDLPGRHYLEWYPLPDRVARDRIAADALALLLNVRLYQRGSLAGMGVQPMAQADVVTPEGRWLLISASLSAETDLDELRAELASVLDELTPAPDAAMLVNGMAEQLNTWPDFGALREQYGDSPQIEFIEAQQVMFQMYAMQNMRLDRSQLALYGTLDVQALEDFAAEVLVTDRRSTLLLGPAGR